MNLSIGISAEHVPAHAKTTWTAEQVVNQEDATDRFRIAMISSRRRGSRGTILEKRGRLERAGAVTAAKQRGPTILRHANRDTRGRSRTSRRGFSAH